MLAMAANLLWPDCDGAIITVINSTWPFNESESTTLEDKIAFASA